MGADGSLVLKRKDLIQQASKASKEDINDSKVYNKDGKWSTCALSNRTLDIPIVSDYLGNLYNKESVLEYLVDPESFSSKQKESMKHIRSLKDVVELKLKRESTTSKFVCPITGDELGRTGVKFVYLVKCKDVFAAKCIKEINKDENKCPLCNQLFDDDDIITLNPATKDDKVKLEKRMLKLDKSNLSHSLQKLKKNKRTISEAENNTKVKAKRLEHKKIRS